MSKERYRYGITYFLVSTLITSLLLIIILKIWYPNTVFSLFGLQKILFFFVLTNCAIWPAFSFLVYKQDKQELKRDLITLLILQIIASSTMLFIIYQSRPVWLVFAANQFDITRVKDVEEDYYPPIIFSEIGILEQFKIFGASFSQDKDRAIEQKNNDIFGRRITFFPSALVNLKDKKEDLNQAMRPLKDLKKYNPEKEVETVLAKYPQATGYFPLKGYVKDGAVLTNQDFTWFQPVSLWPWEDDSALK